MCDSGDGGTVQSSNFAVGSRAGAEDGPNNCVSPDVMRKLHDMAPFIATSKCLNFGPSFGADIDSMHHRLGGSVSPVRLRVNFDDWGRDEESQNETADLDEDKMLNEGLVPLQRPCAEDHQGLINVVASVLHEVGALEFDLIPQ